MYDPNKVINVSFNESGYLEKKNRNNLYDKTANAGSGNYTKYWQDMAPGMQGQPWCNCFVNWIFIMAYGLDAAKKLLCSEKGWSYYTPTSAGYFKNKGQYHKSNPKPGDVIYFRNSSRICHVGLVYKVDASKVYTIEGNTSSAAGVIPNGGGVFLKSYALNNSRIDGYGRPNYGAEIKEPIVSKNTNGYYTKYIGKSQKVDEVLKAIGAPYGNVNKRKPVAIANGISNYAGTAEQNLKLISLAKQGNLKK